MQCNLYKADCMISHRRRSGEEALQLPGGNAAAQLPLRLAVPPEEPGGGGAGPGGLAAAGGGRGAPGHPGQVEEADGHEPGAGHAGLC